MGYLRDDSLGRKYARRARRRGRESSGMGAQEGGRGESKTGEQGNVERSVPKSAGGRSPSIAHVDNRAVETRGRRSTCGCVRVAGEGRDDAAKRARDRDGTES